MLGMTSSILNDGLIRMRKIQTLLLFFCFCLQATAQKEWSNWFQDGKKLVTFKNGYLQIVEGFAPVPAPGDYFNFYHQGAGSVSYSDPVTGDMKFIISGHLGFGTNFKDFPNNQILRSCPGDSYSYHIIPFHNDANKFYVMQFQSCSADLYAQETGLQVVCPNSFGLAYSIVDLNMNSGQGDFSIMNQQITSWLSGQMTTVRHANGKDVWIIVHPYNTSNFNAYLVTDNGISPVVTSAIGPLISGGSANSYGTLTASHDGKLLAGYTRADN
jgi:hypothetical protein